MGVDRKKLTYTLGMIVDVRGPGGGAVAPHFAAVLVHGYAAVVTTARLIDKTKSSFYDKARLTRVTIATQYIAAQQN